MSVLFAAAVSIGGLGGPEPQLAAPADPAPVAASSNLISYPASFFATARPLNAFEMLQRLPGFSFDSGDARVRGFGAAAGNVLIDGQRPSSKAVSLEDLLRRITPQTVERVELIRGGANGVDMQGYAVLANIVRTRAATSTVALTGTALVYSNGRTAPQARLEWSRRQGALSLEGAARAEAYMDDDWGQGSQNRLEPTGVVLSRSRLTIRAPGRLFAANGTAELVRAADSLRFNLGWQRRAERLDQALAPLVANQPGAQALITNGRQLDRSLEGGFDYQRSLTERLSTRLVGIQTLRKNTSQDTSLNGADTSVFRNARRTGESIIRATGTARWSQGFTTDLGFEGAFNFLSGQTALSANGRPVSLPNANVRVEERRGEGFATAAWRPRSDLSFDAAFRVEASRISQTGDTNKERTFVFAKPRLIISYSPGASTQVRLRMEREVGQLNFTDFVASADLNAGTVSAGNAKLEPERAWAFEASLERRFWGKGAAVLTASHAFVGAVVDRIPVTRDIDAPGNIGSGQRGELKAELALPLDRLGLKGGLVTSEIAWRWSKVTDPVALVSRRISNESPVSGKVRFTHDVQALRSTWGLSADFGAQEFWLAERSRGFSRTQYRINEVRQERLGTALTLFWDWKPSPALSVRGEFANLLGQDYFRRRFLYPASRSTSGINVIEERRKGVEPYFMLRVRKLI